MVSPVDLDAALARLRAGDLVSVVFRMQGVECPAVSGELWESVNGSLLLGCMVVQFRDGAAGTGVVRIVGHTPKRRRIVRGDVIASRDDVERFEIPPRTAFRDRVGDAWPTIPSAPSLFRECAPFRCVDVLSDGGS